MCLYLSIQNVFLNMLRFTCIVQKLEWRPGLCTPLTEAGGAVSYASQLQQWMQSEKMQLVPSGATAPVGFS